MNSAWLMWTYRQVAHVTSLTRSVLDALVLRPRTLPDTTLFLMIQLPFPGLRLSHYRNSSTDCRPARMDA
jgi:hypothetical protein